MRDDNLTDAVFAALADCIEVLDHTGTIVAVNDAWRRFMRECGASDLAERAIGLHYQEISRRILGHFDRHVEVEDARAGIEAVLGGSLPEFRLEYPSYIASQPRWYLLRATPLAGPSGGAVVTYLDITEHKLAEEDSAHLLRSEQAARVEAERQCSAAEAARAASEAATRQLEDLRAVTDVALRHLALAKLVPALSDRIRQVLAVDDVSIFLLAENGEALALYSVRGVFAGVRVRIPSDHGVVGRIAASRQPLVIDDVSTATVANPLLRQRLRSLAGVPLMIENRLIGVLHVGTTVPRHFTEADVQLAQLVGDRIAPAVDRARLYDMAQAARQEAETRAGELDATFEAMPDAVLVCDRKRHVVRANRAYRDLMAALRAPGTDTAPLRERTARLTIRNELGHPLPKTHWLMPRLLRGEVLHGTSTLDVSVRSPDGQRWEFNISGAPVRDNQGSEKSDPTGAVAILRDVTERRQLERRTQDALDALLAMAQALTSPDSATAGAGTNTDDDTRRLAEAVRHVLGCERVLLVAMDPQTEHLYPLVGAGWPLKAEHRWRAEIGQFRLRDYLPPPLIAQLQAGEVINYDLAHATARGLLTGSTSRRLLVAPLRLGQKLVGMLAVDFGTTLHDASETERVLIKGTADLTALVLQRNWLWRDRDDARANELALHETAEHMDEFLATASHDLRTPLTTAVGYIDLAAQRYARLAAAVLDQHPDLARLVGAVQSCLDGASRSGEQMSRLVSLLFDTAQARAGKLELHPSICELTAVVREQVEALQVASPNRNIEMKQVGGDREVLVMADGDRIGQVVTNYLTNALKYSADDQPVEVRLTVEAQGARAQLAKVAVEDHGPGLPDDERQHIWQRFYRAQSIRLQSGSGIGLGLGLHICKSIIEQHGGQVGVESVVGKGSVFWFSLPVEMDAQSF